MTRKVHYEDIGEIHFVKNNRNRRLSISVKPFDRVSVKVPDTLSFKSAEDFVLTKKEWIKKSLDKVQNIEKQHTVFTENSQFKTTDYFLRIQKHKKSTLKIVIKNPAIHVFYPHHATISDPRVQRAIRHAVEEAWRIEAKKYLPFRVAELAKKHHFSYNKVFIKNTQTRWGSCSGVNNINLSLHLMRLPAYLTDYVILHELVHTVQKNHGKNFWNLLDKVCGNAKVKEKEMKKYHINVW